MRRVHPESAGFMSATPRTRATDALAVLMLPMPRMGVTGRRTATPDRPRSHICKYPIVSAIFL